MKGGGGVEGGGLGRRDIYKAQLNIRYCAKWLFKAAFKMFMVSLIFDWHLRRGIQ